ncbi:MAG: hypothetical protein R3D29_03250 [Nitratireductor sp.]
MFSAFPLTLFSPVLLLLVSAIALPRPGRRPDGFPKWSEMAAFAALLLSAGGLVQFWLFGPNRIELLNGGMLLAMRADLVSITMAILVSFIGWVVMRYSRTYIDGEDREGRFHGLMLSTLACVLVLVQAASMAMLLIASVAVGLTLKRLLLFYRDRPQAQRASIKFALVWHGGDLALLVSAIVFAIAFGTGDIAALADTATATGLGVIGNLGVAFLVLAAT